MSQPFVYFNYFRTFRVERVPNSTRWQAMGRGPGKPPMALDKLGTSDTQEGMQFLLDGWAKRQGCRPINVKPAAAQMKLAGV